MPGAVYFLTTVTSGRCPVFEDFWTGCAAARTLASPDTWPASTCLAWVLMPDHMHLLVEQGNEALSLTMQRVKGRVSAALRRAHPGMVVWQPGFHDRALRSDDSVIRAARYLVANPIRAGLVQGIGDYPFWDAVWLEEALRGL